MIHFRQLQEKEPFFMLPFYNPEITPGRRQISVSFNNCSYVWHTSCNPYSFFLYLVGL